MRCRWSLLSLHVQKHLTRPLFLEKQLAKVGRPNHVGLGQNEAGIKYGPEFPRRGSELRHQAETGQLAFRQPSLALCSLLSLSPRAAKPRTGRSVSSHLASLSYAPDVQAANQSEALGQARREDKIT
jgi:hypothetical protein